MNRLLQITVVVALSNTSLVVVCADVPLNALSEAERRGGWKLLFDGQTTEGWRNYRSGGINDGWAVRDETLCRVKDGAGDLVTLGQYADFELLIEYRIAPGGNSGIMFRVTEEEAKPWQSGPEVQVLDNAAGRDAQQAGWLYQLYQPVKPGWVRRAEEQAGINSPDIPDATRPAGQWNHVYLRIAANQCEVALNGVSYYRFKLGDKEWDKRVAASKFAKYPNFGKAAQGHICLQDHGDEVAFRNIKIRRRADDAEVPDPVDGQLSLKGVVAFPELKWDDWAPFDDQGRSQPLRPIVLTHAGDQTNRIFVATQRGVIHVFDNEPAAKKTQRFLDITPKVDSWREDNEEGLLGLAFHPNYKRNGQFFVYYSSAEEPRVSIVSRWRVSPDDPNQADPDSEEIVMKIPQPFANHNGGSIVFGHDGYLYIGLGDGGSRNDPLGNGQNLETWMGSILRIDIDGKTDSRKYAIPADNPFQDRPGAKPEIYAYGFRNVWRLAVDRKTGDLWAGDVGQDLWEEVNIVRRGGNYGWSIREATLPFGNRPPSTADQPIDPIWEYDHQVGKSITGGMVYRGDRLPELNGWYLYADYASGKIWALRYDAASGKVARNLRIPSPRIPVLAFGEDETGEVYYLIQAANGQGIIRFERTEVPAATEAANSR